MYNFFSILTLFYHTAYMSFFKRWSYINGNSFPGGKHDKDDKDYIHTALRETEEEIGLSGSGVHILGTLKAFPDRVSSLQDSLKICKYCRLE